MEDRIPAKSPARVVFIDDHAMLRDLVALVVNSQSGYQLVGWAQDEETASALCRQHQPDIVILDLVLARSSGMLLLDRLPTLCPRARVIIFSGYLSPEVVKRALAVGAWAIVSKVASLDEFRAALKAVSAGRAYFSAEVAETIKRIVAHPAAAAPPGHDRLTLREMTILRYLAQGLSSKEIADKLGVSVYTVLNHRTRMMRKTGLHRTAQLSVYAMRMGLMSADQLCAQV